MNRAAKLLLAFCLAGAVLRVGTALALGDAVEALPGIHDQISYHTLALRVLEGHGFSFGYTWWPATRAGEPTAHWSYLYTVFLVLVYQVFGVHPLAARLVQGAAAGFLLPWLSFRLARRVFQTEAGRKKASLRVELIALFAAAWSAGYPYFLYYASALMTETFFMLGVLWMLDISFQIRDRSDGGNGKVGVRHWILLGLVCGATALLRQLILMWIPFLFAWLVFVSTRRERPSRQMRQRLGGLLISGLVISGMILPFTMFNYARFGRFVLLNTNAGYAFFWANHPIHADHFIPILGADQPSYQELIPKELLALDEAALDQALLKEGVKFVLEDPGRYLRLSFSRIPVYFQFWPSAESSLPSNLTRVSSFGLALPFMVIGTGGWIWEVRKRRLPGAPGSLLILFALVYSGIHLASWALIRYRLPVDAVMLVFGAYGLAMFLMKLGILPWLEAKVCGEDSLSGSLRPNTDPDQAV